MQVTVKCAESLARCIPNHLYKLNQYHEGRYEVFVRRLSTYIGNVSKLFMRIFDLPPLTR